MFSWRCFLLKKQELWRPVILLVIEIKAGFFPLGYLGSGLLDPSGEFGVESIYLIRMLFRQVGLFSEVGAEIVELVGVGCVEADELPVPFADGVGRAVARTVVVRVGPGERSLIKGRSSIAQESGFEGCSIEVLFREEFLISEIEKGGHYVHGDHRGVADAGFEFAFPRNDGGDADTTFESPSFARLERKVASDAGRFFEMAMTTVVGGEEDDSVFGELEFIERG